jgi:hypothetical protein
MVNIHNITQLISWYHHASELEADANDYADIIQNDFKAIQELANELDLLQFCFPRAGSISIIHPSNEDPNLSFLHRSITTSSNSIYASRYLCHHTVRKFFVNFSMNDVEEISKRKTSKVTMLELVIVLSRMLECQERNEDYPDIHGNDLPYRSKSWVLGLINYLETEFIWRFCDTEEYRYLDRIVKGVIVVLDNYEVEIQVHENRLMGHV